MSPRESVPAVSQWGRQHDDLYRALGLGAMFEQNQCWAFGHETEDEPVCIHCGKPVVGP